MYVISSIDWGFIGAGQKQWRTFYGLRVCKSVGNQAEIHPGQILTFCMVQYNVCICPSSTHTHSLSGAHNQLSAVITLAQIYATGQKLIKPKKRKNVCTLCVYICTKVCVFNSHRLYIKNLKEIYDTSQL